MLKIHGQLYGPSAVTMYNLRLDDKPDLHCQGTEIELTKAEAEPLIEMGVLQEPMVSQEAYDTLKLTEEKLQQEVSQLTRLRQRMYPGKLPTKSKDHVTLPLKKVSTVRSGGGPKFIGPKPSKGKPKPSGTPKKVGH
jgi:hypothetical protein